MSRPPSPLPSPPPSLPLPPSPPPIQIDKRDSIYSIGLSTCRNKRRTMEDAHIISFDLDSAVLLAILDGHGGKEASKFASNAFVSLLKQKITGNESILESLTESFKEIDEMICDPIRDIFSGTTATVAIIDNLSIYTANVGDSQSFLMNSKESIPLTQKHNPTRGSEEEKRIINEGGIVRNERVLGILAVSRSLGDISLKPWVSPIPFIKKTPIPNDRKEFFIIIASDGLWDFVSIENCRICVFNEFCKDLDKSSLAQRSSDSLLELAKYEGSDDNISIIVVIL